MKSQNSKLNCLPTLFFSFRGLFQGFALFLIQLLLSEGLLRANLDPMEYVQWDFIEELKTENGYLVEIQLTAVAPFRVYEDKLYFKATSPQKIIDIQRPKTVFFKDPLTDSPTRVYEEGRFKFMIQSERSTETPELVIQYVACTDSICSRPIQVTYKNSMIHSKLAPPGSEIYLKENSEGIEINSDLAEKTPSLPLFEIDKTWTLAFFSILFFAGLATNLTPCVYPMIPITLRVMSIPGSNSILSAFSYSLGIVVTYTSLGVLAASSGSLFGSFLASPIFSLGFALLMAFLGFSMLGFGDLSFLQNIGSRLGSGKPGPINTFAMGAGAGLVAAPCTGPILAALIAWIAKSGNTQAGTLLLFTYSVGFALPYLILGSLAKNVLKIKISPGLQIFTKYVFAAVMFTLSAYYARIPFYKQLQVLQPVFPQIALAFLIGSIISFSIGFFGDKDARQKKFLYSFSSIFIGFFLFFIWQYSFAQPSQINWHKDELTAFTIAKKEQKPVFIDAWAEWCEACKKMDVTTLSDPEVVRELNEKWISIKLDLTENSELNEGIYQKYGIQTLPSYIFIPVEKLDSVLSQNFTELQIYNGYLEIEDFLEQLNLAKKNQGIDKNKSEAQ